MAKAERYLILIAHPSATDGTDAQTSAFVTVAGTETRTHPFATANGTDSVSDAWRKRVPEVSTGVRVPSAVADG